MEQIHTVSERFLVLNKEFLASPLLLGLEKCSCTWFNLLADARAK